MRAKQMWYALRPFALAYHENRQADRDDYRRAAETFRDSEHVLGVHRIGYVYVVTDGAQSKIGHSHNPLDRVSQMQCGSPALLWLAHVVPGGRQVEAEFHRRYDGDRLLGEWFGLTPSEAAVRLEQIRREIDDPGDR